jgi:hypothetical protein
MVMPWTCSVNDNDGMSTEDRHGSLSRSTSTVLSGVGARNFFFFQLMTV